MIETNVAHDYKKSLAYRLIQAVNAIGPIEKKGYNATKDYPWLRASDVAEKFREQLFKRHILVTCDEKPPKGRTVQTVGGPMLLITVELQFYFHCALTGEVIGPRSAFGQAMDAGDKGIFKAKTGAVKYFFKILGLIPDETDDPEADETVDKFTAGKANGKPATQSRPAPSKAPARTYNGRSFHELQMSYRISLHQVKMWTDAIRITGKTETQELAYLKTKFGIERVQQATRGQFQDALRWALGTEDLESTLTTSLQNVEAKKGNGKAQPAAELLDRVDLEEIG